MNQTVNVNIDELPNVKCVCGSELYTNIFMVKKISALQSPTGKEEIMPSPLIVCSNCGKPLEEILNPTVVN